MDHPIQSLSTFRWINDLDLSQLDALKIRFLEETSDENGFSFFDLNDNITNPNGLINVRQFIDWVYALEECYYVETFKPALMGKNAIFENNTENVFPLKIASSEGAFVVNSFFEMAQVVDKWEFSDYLHSYESYFFRNTLFYFEPIQSHLRVLEYRIESERFFILIQNGKQYFINSPSDIYPIFGDDCEDLIHFLWKFSISEEYNIIL